MCFLSIISKRAGSNKKSRNIANNIEKIVISPKSTFILKAEAVKTRKPHIKIIVLTTIAIPTLENAVVKAPKPVEKNLSEGLNAAKGNTEEEKLQEQSKKEMYANAWQNSGVGHIVEAVKSIRRGIKKNKAKKAGKEAKKVIGNKLKNSVRKPKSKTANLKTAGIKGPTINAMGQTKFKDLSKTKIS